MNQSAHPLTLFTSALTLAAEGDFDAAGDLLSLAERRADDMLAPCLITHKRAKSCLSIGRDGRPLHVNWGGPCQACRNH